MGPSQLCQQHGGRPGEALFLIPLVQPGLMPDSDGGVMIIIRGVRYISLAFRWQTLLATGEHRQIGGQGFLWVG
jgi:hypothetical protein